MMLTRKLSELLKSLTFSGTANGILSTDSNGNLGKVSGRNLANMVFSSISNSENLDEPASKGIFNVTPDTPITRPTKGTGWSYGYVMNMAVATGVQVWVNFSGYIAVRGKGSAGASWSEWKVTAFL